MGKSRVGRACALKQQDCGLHGVVSLHAPTTKLNPDSAEDKATVDKYLLWEGDFGGRDVADGKVFK